MSIHQLKSKIYNDISNYFNNPIFTKKSDITLANGFQYSLYYCRVGCMLCLENRYIVAICMIDNAFDGNMERLSNLKWISLQTRTIDESPIPNLQIQEIKSNNRLDEKVYLTKQNGDRYIYNCETYPLKVELLTDNQNDKYSHTGTIKSCLDTYNCVLTFVI